jgi:ubiquinone/menaquinone biosynthesis C-methylase UbiE
VTSRITVRNRRSSSSSPAWRGWNNSAGRLTGSREGGELLIEGRATSSRFYDGWIYARFLERFQRGLHGFIAERMSLSGRILDIGCGTGSLALRLAPTVEAVVGVDLSPAMVSYADQQRRKRGVTNASFVVGDIVNALTEQPDGGFDAATLILVLHELPPDTRVPVLQEAVRLCRQVLCVDFRVPMPLNFAGLRNRLIEVVAGPEHFGAFRDFSRRGGTAAIAHSAGLSCRHLRHLDAETLDVFMLQAAPAEIRGHSAEGAPRRPPPC